MSEALTEDLRQEIAKGSCVAVVGAGVSIFSTGNAPCASWTGLLHHGVQRCADVITSLPADWAERANKDIDSGDLDDLLAGAEKVSNKLGAPNGGEYARWLRESVGVLDAGHREILEALRDIGVIIATTNYDDLIEKVTGLPAVTWMDGARVERVLRGDERAVLHLHGYWQRPESVILGIRSYEQVLGSEHAQAMLRALATMRTMLFIGCGDGLHDPNFGALLKWTGTVFAGSEYRRFRLARSSEVAQLQKASPLEQRLFVLSYGTDFDDLAPFLLRLQNAGRPRSEESPPVPTGASALPPRPRCFGRDEEIADLVAALLVLQPEPVPVLGPPGIGKTNLALTVAHDARVEARYGSRRSFVRCDGLRSRAALAGAIASTLGLTLSPNNESAVLVELGRAPTLLIVDNAETPWDSDTLEVEELLGRLTGVPGLALLVTLRGNERPAGVAWREAFRPQPISPAAARELFLSLAGRQFAGDPHLDDLLSALDHVPLAITLVAALAEGEPSLHSLWQRWQSERTAMLQRAGGKDRLTNIELSYELSWSGARMTSDAKRLLQLLALLPAGLAHADLALVLPQANTAARTLRKAGLAFDEANRLRVLAPLREYVRRRYPPASEDLQRMITHFVSLVAEYGAQLGKAQGGAARARLLADAQNIETMLLRGLADVASGAVIKAAPAWAEFVRFAGAGSPAPIEVAATAAKRAGDLLGEANCIKGLGDIARVRSDHDGAQARYEEARQLYRQVGDPLGEASCIRRLGDIARTRSDHDGAQARYEAALQLYRQEDDLLGEADCIKGLGDIALARSDHDGARAHYEAALQLYRQGGDLLGEANCISRLGDIARARSDHDGAQARSEAALPLYHQVGDSLGEANCILSLGEIARARADHGGARARYEAALPLYRLVGNLLGEANCISGLGDSARARSDHDGARAHYDAALPLYHRVGNLLGEGNCHVGIARLYMAQGQPSEATVRFSDALGCYERFGDPYSVGAAHFFWAQVCDGEEREAHQQANRQAWRSLDRQALCGMAAMDGIQPAEIETLDEGSASSGGRQGRVIDAG